jgi:hypothetical protein
LKIGSIQLRAFLPTVAGITQTDSSGTLEDREDENGGALERRSGEIPWLWSPIWVV